MIQPIQLTDPSFQPQLAGKCDLHLEIFPGGMHAALVDKGQDQLKALFSNPLADTAALQDFISTESSFGYHFRKVKISVHTHAFTFIPDDLFDSSLLADYAKFIGAGVEDKLFCESIRSAKCKVVFAAPAATVDLLNIQFHQPQFFPAAAACIEAGAQWAKHAEGPMMLLNLLSESFEAAYFMEGKLEYYNTFPKRTADEFNYFLLSIFDGMSIKPAETEFILGGNVDTEAIARLEKYTANIRKADKQQFIKLSETFETLEPTEFYALTALSLCE